MQEGQPDWDKLVRLMARLRSETGCPWDRAQTHASLKPFVIEEAYEVVEAIDGGEAPRLREELGDLLLQVVFHAQIASEQGEFDLSGVVATLVDKLIRRHPHVFDQEEDLTADQVPGRWQSIKASQGGSLFDGLPPSLPALLRAQRVGARAGGMGFDWSGPQPVLEKIHEELDEVYGALGEGPTRLFEEVGDLLFAVVNLARHLKVESEDALRAATSRFIERFTTAVRLAEERSMGWPQGDDEALDQLWEQAKAILARGGPEKVE